jgi:hypothetical protein
MRRLDLFILAGIDVEYTRFIDNEKVAIKTYTRSMWPK